MKGLLEMKESLKVNYKFYETGKNFEEVQAQIYNAAIKGTGAFEVTPENIKQRYQSENPDPKGIRYAFKEDGTPLAYIQTRVTKVPEPQTWIGPPWAVPECPSEVKTKLYSEMYEYIKERDLKKSPEQKLMMGYFEEVLEDQINFAKENGFELDNTAYEFHLNVERVGKEKAPDLKSRIATSNDLDPLLELSNVDPRLKDVFPNNDARTAYFRDKVLPDGHTQLIFNEKNELICAGAPLKGYVKDGTIIRFTAVRPGSDDALRTLIVEICKHCVEQGWNDNPIIVYGDYSPDDILSKHVQDLKPDRSKPSYVFSKVIKQGLRV